jgi:hypothetical protein
MSGSSYDAPLDALRRWEDSGGTWLLVHDDGERMAVDLLTCSGGEVMATLRWDDPALRAYVLQAQLDGTRTEPS